MGHRLLLAVINNDVITTTKCLNSGSDPDVTWPDGMTGLHVASQNASLPISQVLIQHKADVNRRNKDGRTPLHLACLTDNIEYIKYLIGQGTDVHTEDNQGLPPILLAAKYGCENALLVLSEKSSVNLKTKDGETALHLATSQCHTGCVRLLCEKGADVNATTTDGSTSLAVASRAGHYGCVQILLEHQAEVGIANTGGLQALHQACVGNHADIVELLLQYGADQNVYTGEDELPCRLTTSRKCHEVLQKWIEGSKMDWQSQYGFIKGVNEPIYYITCSDSFLIHISYIYIYTIHQDIYYPYLITAEINKIHNNFS